MKAVVTLKEEGKFSTSDYGSRVFKIEQYYSVAREEVGLGGLKGLNYRKCFGCVGGGVWYSALDCNVIGTERL